MERGPSPYHLRSRRVAGAPRSLIPSRFGRLSGASFASSSGSAVPSDIYGNSGDNVPTPVSHPYTKDQHNEGTRFTNAPNDPPVVPLDNTPLTAAVKSPQLVRRKNNSASIKRQSTAVPQSPTLIKPPTWSRAGHTPKVSMENLQPKDMTPTLQLPPTRNSTQSLSSSLKRGAMWSMLPLVSQAMGKSVMEGPSEMPRGKYTSHRWSGKGTVSTAGKLGKCASSPILVRTLSEGVSFSTLDLRTFPSEITNMLDDLGPPDNNPEKVMSEMVPETRPKPVVPMKPVGMSPNLLGYIGIDTIIEQMRKKTMKTGFDFNIMVVGQSGLGKSTLVNTLFKSQVSRKSAGWSRDDKIPKTVEIKSISHVIEEGGVKMKLTVIDTPGFGDQINNENCWEPIEKFINEQYEKFLKEEVNISRKKRIPDTRVHCCLYFISPTGHSLRPLDLEFMKHLSKVVNIIPVIAKADTMTLEEKIEFKQRVRKELEMNGIEFYPQKEFDDDLEDKTENDKIRQESMPFAVVGSDKEYQVNGKRVLGRKTPWGIVEVENLSHCEFSLLRDFVIRTHLQDLKEVTHNIHYETYRAKRLNENGGLPPVSADTEEIHDSNI
ncbi:neuronal-specific septin-3 [Bombina bombina]|uniref:neuronal-specific septin-3 n=1 Tax=Bombina bombina TaxID=8345 RepID=UPI00235B0945|nr:neuronal-specific septin-3 [Bombina bombina]